jgi:hypothetical protein
MKDRRDLQDELNRINELYQQYDLELRKSGGSDAQRQQMRDTLNAKKAKITAEMGDDLQNLNLGKNVKVPGGTLSGTEMDQSNLPDMSKQKGLGKEGMFKKLGKKVASRGLKALPVIGTIAGLASAGEAAYAGDYDKAKEELVSAADPTGLSDVALAARDVAETKQDYDTTQKMMLAEDKARKAYAQSPAAAGAKEAALKKLRGY